ncbi:MAG: patatin-like phospholipase family protein [Chloroflexi bacterium]|nr:patatin-like phospholipase family protein [Chloroflexota bacterium]
MVRERLRLGWQIAPEHEHEAEPHPVVTALLERARSGSRPGRRTDGHRIALVVEGGAMRGVVSGGMVAGLEALGLRDAFDVVYGSSAGACAGAYFLAGQARVGARLYYEVVNTRQYINPLHALRRRAIVNLDRLFDHVLSQQLPLDFEAFQASGVPLVVLASHVDVVAATGTDGPHAIVEADRFTDFADVDDLLGALHASSRMPVVGGAPVSYRGMRFWDAAITQPVPVHAALDDGCTHVLVLMTLPRHARPGGFGLLDRLLVAPRVANVSPGLASMYRTRSVRYMETWQLILSRSQTREGPPFVEGVAADASTPVIGRTEIRTPRLVAAARAGGNAVLAAFGRGDAHMTQQLLPIGRAGHAVDVRLGSAAGGVVGRGTESAAS